MKYDFTITLHPYGGNPSLGVVAIDPAACYGYWERRNGIEGGGLWFEQLPDGKLELVDYDGAYSLPPAVTTALRQAGVVVSTDFD